MSLRSARGFTLIEIMLTVAVMSIGLLAIIYGNTMIQQASETAFERARAMQHANQVVERMRNAAATGLSDVTADFSNNGTVNYTQYTTCTALPCAQQLPSETVTVSYVSTSANPLDATVTVTWLSRGIRTVNKSLRTYLTRR